jgi:hypothetical protein
VFICEICERLFFYTKEKIALKNATLLSASELLFQATKASNRIISLLVHKNADILSVNLDSSGIRILKTIFKNSKKKGLKSKLTPCFSSHYSKFFFVLKN